MGRGPVGEPAIIRYVNNSLASVTDVSKTDGAMILIKTLTASSSSTISFVHGTSDVVLDGTYPIYVFKFINIHPSAANQFEFQVSTDSGSSYGVNITSTWFRAKHEEDDGGTQLAYITGGDLAQSTSYQRLQVPYTDNDMSISSTLNLYSPSSTTFVKHFMYTGQAYNYSSSEAVSENAFVAGYVNSTSAINAVQFKLSSGNIDSGTIKLYGIKDS